jgi:hypothetical protein
MSSNDIEYSINSFLNTVDFENLTLQTLDFETPFPMEYSYNVWKSHQITGEELRKTFWEYMNLYCEKYFNKIEKYDRCACVQSWSKTFVFSTYLFLVEEYQRYNHTLLPIYLFMWYAPELLEALTDEDYKTLVAVNTFREQPLDATSSALQIKPDGTSDTNSDLIEFQDSKDDTESELKDIQNLETMEEEPELDLEKFPNVIKNDSIFKSFKIDFRDYIPRDLKFNITPKPFLTVYGMLEKLLRYSADVMRIYKLRQEILNEDNKSLHIRNYAPNIIREARDVRTFVNSHKLDLKRIQEDDMDYVRSWHHERSCHALNNFKTLEPFTPIDLLQRIRYLSIFDLAIYFKSMNIIKYLILNGATACESTFLIATAVGTPELIRICLSHWWRKFEYKAKANSVPDRLHELNSDENDDNRNYSNTSATPLSYEDWVLKPDLKMLMDIIAVQYNHQYIREWLNIENTSKHSHTLPVTFTKFLNKILSWIENNIHPNGIQAPKEKSDTEEYFIEVDEGESVRYTVTQNGSKHFNKL